MATRLALVLSAVLGFILTIDAHRGAYDFQAFYCAGSALRAGANPYRTEPLRACEHAQTDGTYAALPPQAALPAPQPPYDLVVFAAFSLLPFALAKAAWGALLGLSSAIAVIALAKIAREPVMPAFMALAASLILPSFAFGQIFPLYGAACVLAALFAQREQWMLCGIAAGAALVEPHLGLPVCLSVAIWNRRARIAVVLSAIVFAALSLAAVGWSGCLEYVATVLPLHAASEIASNAQLSLSAVLHAAGVSATWALRFGEFSYAAMAVAGVWLGRLAATRRADAAFVITVPAALAIAGGTFIHATEMFAAVPLAMLLARTRRAAAAALVLLSVPWFTVLDGGMPAAFILLAAIVVFYEARQFGGKPIVAPIVSACAVAVLVYASHAHVRLAPVWHPAPNSLYPQESWRMLTVQTLSSNDGASWLLRVPSWAGLLLLACTTAFYALRGTGRKEAPCETHYGEPAPPPWQSTSARSTP